MVDFTTASGYTTDSSGNRQFQDRDKVNGVDGTSLVAADKNMDRNELVNAVKASGQVLDGANHAQLALAVQALGNIRPYSKELSDAISGYWLGAVVVDDSGTYWKSTVAANTTAPGGEGAKWISLFNGYATQDWATDAFLQLNSATSQTVSGPVAFSTGPQVPTQPANQSGLYAANTAFVAELAAVQAKLAGGNSFTGTQTFNDAITVPNGVNAQNPVTMGQFTQNKLSQGYQKFPNGFILQWDQIIVSASSSPGTSTLTNITLPFAFPNNFVGVIGIDAGSGCHSISAVPTGAGTASFTSRYFNDGATTTGVRYLAWGF